jgi:uncharacterized protein (DUF1684 family)
MNEKISMRESYIQLADYRRLVNGIYTQVRESQLDPKERWLKFRTDRDRLIRTHPQTPLTADQVNQFTSLRYYPYNHNLRFELTIEPLDDDLVVPVDLQEDGLAQLKSVGRVRFKVGQQPVSLTLFWFSGYGGGLFLPFQDLTNGLATYAGGRYLLDTIKGADLGMQAERIILDFNFSYNPSCAYNPRWNCPLSPPENRLPVPIEAGELSFP